MKSTYIAGLLSLLSLALLASPALAYTKKHHRSTSPAPVDQTVASGSLMLPPISVQTPVPVPTPAPTTPSVTVTVTSPPTVNTAVSTSGEVRMSAYTTGYGWPDNTPAGAAISNGVIHSLAGGTGTFADPITVAVGHSISGGKDTLDYPAGTKFYVPDLRKYFIAEDTCGDGNTPQNGPCHTGYQGHVWLDLWVGGVGLSSSGTLACEDAITDIHMVIENPASNYAVVSGPVYNGSCASEYGDTVITQ